MKQFYTSSSLHLVRSTPFVVPGVVKHISGDIIEVQLPSATVNPNQPSGTGIRDFMLVVPQILTDAKHRGFGFITYASPADAQDAMDNMDLNELRGKVIKVNLARPMKGPIQPLGNRAGGYSVYFSFIERRLVLSLGVRRVVKRIRQTIG